MGKAEKLVFNEYFILNDNSLSKIKNKDIEQLKIELSNFENDILTYLKITSETKPNFEIHLKEILDKIYLSEKYSEKIHNIQIKNIYTETYDLFEKRLRRIYGKLYEKPFRNVVEKLFRKNIPSEYNFSTFLKKQNIIKEKNGIITFNILEKPSLKNVKKDIKENIWFKVGCKFADGSIYKLQSEGKTFKKIAEELFNNKNYSNYISESFADSTESDKNIFCNLQKVQSIHNYLKDSNIPICDKFETKYQNLISKQNNT